MNLRTTLFFLALMTATLNAQPLRQVPGTWNDADYVRQTDDLWAIGQRGSAYEDRLVRINPNTGEVKGQYVVPGNPVSMTAAPNGRTIIIGTQESKRLFFLIYSNWK